MILNKKESQNKKIKRGARPLRNVVAPAPDVLWTDYSNSLLSHLFRAGFNGDPRAVDYILNHTLQDDTGDMSFQANRSSQKADFISMSYRSIISWKLEVFRQYSILSQKKSLYTNKTKKNFL